LDKVAEQGDEIIIKTKDGVRPGTTLAREIDYLRAEKGYDWKDDAKNVLIKQ
jgi:hypothetical protein